jgi:hypothetical protein
MSKKKQADKSDRVLRPLGLIFFILGIGLMFNESTRLAGLPFLLTGGILLLVGDSPEPEDKKNSKK